MRALVVQAPLTRTELLSVVTAAIQADGEAIGSSQAQLLLAQGSVYVGKLREHNGKRALTGETITIMQPQLPIIPYHLDPKLVVYEDAHLLLVYKPANLNTCPSVYSDVDCLAHAVQQYLDNTITQNSYIVNTINRLDRDTQGLVFFAKNKTCEVYLHRMFMERTVSKRYLLVVADNSQSGNLPTHLRVSDELEWQGKLQAAQTGFKRLPCQSENDSGLVLYLAFPQTGRTHQIRKHCARYLAPIVGDRVYGQADGGQALGLICVGYRFRHPLTGRSSAVAVPLRLLRELEFANLGFNFIDIG